ncbi:apoptotic chromatin condensation inducer in the nucleus [Planococcus citri]|uniref:apoptotic chromatin condensation inducer in the nucleus n=1 Tax=Planococcus citri TaxID=170843 RepID=UPI0031F73396
MKKKSGSKSKDRDKTKNDESKSHKHSRRRRKSSSSESDVESDVKPELSDDSKPKRGSGAKKETENNVAMQRITRHSKRLAAISAGSDEIKEELNEIASPVKTGKSSPFSGSECRGSPSKEKKRDGSTPDKHKTKDSEVWKVKSANGAGTGELQKLKICRQRSPEPSTDIVDDENSVEASDAEAEPVETNNVYENKTSNEQAAFPVNDEDIANIQLPSDDLQTSAAIADIELPSDDVQSSDAIAEIQLPADSPTSVAVAEIQLPADSPTSVAVAEIQLPADSPTSVAVADIQLPSSDVQSRTAIANIQLPSDDVELPAAVSSIQLPSDDIQAPMVISDIQLPADDVQMPSVVEAIPVPPETTALSENTVSEESSADQAESNIIPDEDISQISLPADEPKQPVQCVEESVSVQPEQPVEQVKDAESEQESSVDAIQTEEPVTEVSEIPEPQEAPKVEEPPPSQPEEPVTTEVSQPSPSPAAEEETVPPESVSIPEETSQSSPIAPAQTSVPIQESEKPHSSPRVSEPEDGMQTELVLTVEEPLEEANELVEPETKPVEAAVKTSASEKDSDSRLNKSIEEMEEVYDYEHDDTKEEGELSANESISPIHEVFNRKPPGERTRAWGCCNVFHFSRANSSANEHTLKELNIKKRVVSKDEFDTSDPEDLIFVKEIREENIVHEIESENNNTYVDKDEDDVVPLSPKYDSDKEKSKKRLSDSDRRKSYSRDQLNEEKSSGSRRTVLRDKSQSSDGRSVLYITNLVRPFTVTQLRELLLRTGKIVEDGFWIDSIKSKCYVQFETEDEALETRHALHGIRWPVNNPKVLNVQFASQDDLLNAQAQTHESEIPRKTEPLIVENHVERRGIDWKKHFEQYDDRPVRKVKDVREWDIGKPAHPDEMVYAEPEDNRRTKENLDKDRKPLRTTRDRRRRNENSDEESSSRKQRKTANESEPPPTEAKLLDDLFRRTKASPSIYWLPLSEEQIAVKQETRRKNLEDLDKQFKQRKDGDGGGDRDRRRDRDRDRDRRRGSRR